MDAQLTAYVVDDDVDVRRRLIQTLADASIHARSFARGEEFLDECDPSIGGCVILDMKMPGLSGMDVYRQMRARGILLPVIFLTAHASVPTAVRSMEVGAAAFIEKPCDPQDLIRRIHHLMSQAHARQHDQKQRDEFRHHLDCLTQRERQILMMVVEGMTSKDVARTLGTSVRTVETQRRNIMRKMKVTTIAQLAWLLARNGVSDANPPPPPQPAASAPS